MKAPVLSLIGNTPLVPLYFSEVDRTIYCKAEYLNPSGSIKDRLAKYVLEHAEQNGLIHKDSIILECSSGNTGISFAMVGTAMGYAVEIVMSEKASIERHHLIRQLGAELTLFGDSSSYSAGIDLTREKVAGNPNYFLPKQFENPLNAEEHQHVTGPELIEQMHGDIDGFVAGYGTGGTLTGIGKALKNNNPKTIVAAMEPAEAAMLSGDMACGHSIEGIAGGFVPPLMADAPLDQIHKVSSEAAVLMTRRLNREFGLLVGTSSGANIVAALEIARTLGPDSRVTTVLPDRAERYFSTALFDRKAKPEDMTIPGIGCGCCC
ncbi:MAG: PLP-dependent cysteine synthase family protein [Verrucomicrobiales bacterium]|nr:cysteine synthase family protein [Verrucomicrobiota bacterium JB025]